MTIEQDAIWLAKAVLKLIDAGYIQTYDEDEEADCDHLKRIALHHARKIQILTTVKTTEELEP